ncbi:molybdenum cofactor guanylyltransferase [Natronomonas moolapensis 8.8.11]|uniref:Probable molybdenum cofactor guanylyltransferase n=1 Tax=Natronomonas moolapensis (strain DSM 18674 / CECT 7526 / JCM 14361 / 8.8.11) TaxID=268739 RepID=M1XSJ8_NATM8|nr:molybdenum cofactor guanylyltransferase [Natronomonas moolapensis]CCQ37316.1 molybdenum cofactor guanylyltransferase [Natronomonas moolapensis 8.8.11]
MDARSGVIVAGGRSVRMGGTEKTVVDVAGTPLIRRVADRLCAATDELVINCREDQRDSIAGALDGLDPRFAVDEVPDRGPVAGIETGLEAAETEYSVVVAADMPFLDPDLLSYLFERAADHEAAVPRPGEWFEPLHAVYRAAPSIEACERALEVEDPRIIEPLSTLDRVVVDRDDLLAHGSLDSFESVDTPDDVEWATSRLG